MKSVTEILADPLYAAIIGAIIGFVAKIVDNRMSDTKGTFGGYFKSVAFSAGLLALWTFVSRPRSGGRMASGGGGSMSPDRFIPRRPQPFAAQGYQ